MIGKLINFIILVPIAIVLITLSVANRDIVTLILNPLDPHDTALSISAPFFVFIFIALMAGMTIGALVTRFRQGRYRKNARLKDQQAVGRQHKEIGN